MLLYIIAIVYQNHAGAAQDMTMIPAKLVGGVLMSCITNQYLICTASLGYSST
jgi:hypothetical protein